MSDGVHTMQEYESYHSHLELDVLGMFKKLINFLLQGLKIQLKFLSKFALFTISVTSLPVGVPIWIERDIGPIVLRPLDAAIVLEVHPFALPAGCISVIELVFEVVEGGHGFSKLFADLRVHLNSGVILC